MAFFIMTGVAIIFYLNQYPNQPRERDYAYAGSFYAFAIWIGIGFMFVYEKMQKFLENKTSLVVTFILLITSAPVLMGTQNWDDHNRSGRYTARDIAANYLNSCAPKSILFTYGDNDSFPLWYIQEVEKVRTDVRVANLSYLQAGWYIGMMRQKAYDSGPIPLSLAPAKYIEGVREQLLVDNRVNKPVDLGEVVQFAGLDDKKYMIPVSDTGDYLNFLPANKFKIDVDTVKVLSNGTVKKYFKDRLVSPMIWEYSENYALKDELVIMDLLSTNKWERPVYFSTTVPPDQFNGLEKFFIQEGLGYRIAPVRTEKPEPGEYGMIDPFIMYDNMMNKFKWGNAADPSVYLDENNRRMFNYFRNMFGNLGIALLDKGDTIKALKAAHRGLEIVPTAKMPNDYYSVRIAEVLLRSGNIEEGEKVIKEVIDTSKQHLNYVLSINEGNRFGLGIMTGISMQALLDTYYMSDRIKSTTLSAVIEPELNYYYPKFYPK
jgi:tetratricopeptide (TPR) repeat protein